MLLTEKDLQLLQTCPRKYQFAKDKLSLENLSSIQIKLAIWMWSYEIQTNRKVSLPLVKQKWSSLITKSNLQKVSKGSPLKPTTQLIATGFPLVKEAWEHYLDLDFKPIATQLPLRHTVEHAGTVQSILPVVVMNKQGNAVVLAYHANTTSQQQANSLVTRTQLVTASNHLDATKHISYSMTTKFSPTYVSVQDTNKDKLDISLQYLLELAKNKINYPIFNCTLQCEFKNVCY